MSLSEKFLEEYNNIKKISKEDAEALLRSFMLRKDIDTEKKKKAFLHELIDTLNMNKKKKNTSVPNLINAIASNIQSMINNIILNNDEKKEESIKVIEYKNGNKNI